MAEGNALPHPEKALQCAREIRIVFSHKTLRFLGFGAIAVAFIGVVLASPPGPPVLSLADLAVESDGPQEENDTATLSLPQVAVAPGVQVTVPLTLALTQGDVYSADIVMTYNPEVVVATAVQKGALVAGWSMASNLETLGEIRVALAGATPVVTGGELLLIIFGAVGPIGSETHLTLIRGELNEGGIPATLHHGHLVIALPTATPTPTPSYTATPTPTSTPTYGIRIYLPLVLRNYP